MDEDGNSLCQFYNVSVRLRLFFLTHLKRKLKKEKTCFPKHVLLNLTIIISPKLWFKTLSNL